MQQRGARPKPGPIWLEQQVRYFKPNWKAMVEPSFSVISNTYVFPAERFFVLMLKT